MTTEELCGICGCTREEHSRREEARNVNHAWNLAGNLIPLDRKPKPTRPTQPVIVIVDAELREVLLRKGVITVEDFAALRDSRPGPAGDREAGQTAGAN